MLTVVKAKSKHTEEYNRWLIGTMAEHFPYRVGEAIDFNIVEEKTPFPDFIEMPVNPEGKGIVLAEQYGNLKLTTGVLPNPSKDIFDQTRNEKERRSVKAEMLLDYTERFLEKMCSFKNAEITDDGPIDIKCTFLVTDTDKISEEVKRFRALQEKKIKMCY